MDVVALMREKFPDFSITLATIAKNENITFKQFLETERVQNEMNKLLPSTVAEVEAVNQVLADCKKVYDKYFEQGVSFFAACAAYQTP